MPPISPDLEDLFLSLSPEDMTFLALVILLDSRSLPLPLVKLVAPEKRPLPVHRPAEIYDKVRRIRSLKKPGHLLWSGEFLVRLLTHFAETAPPPLRAALRHELKFGHTSMVKRYRYRYSDTLYQEYACLLLYLFEKDEPAFLDFFTELESTVRNRDLLKACRRIIAELPIPGEWLDTAPGGIREALLAATTEELIESSPLHLFDIPGRLSRLRALPFSEPNGSRAWQAGLHLDLLSGSKTRIEAIISASPPPSLPMIQGISAWERFMAGDPREAAQGFSAMATTLRKMKIHKKSPLPEPFALFEGLSLLALSRTDPLARELFLQQNAAVTRANSVHYLGHLSLRILDAGDHLSVSAVESLLAEAKTIYSSASPISVALYTVALSIVAPDTLTFQISPNFSLDERWQSETLLISYLLAFALSRSPKAPPELKTKVASDPRLAPFHAPFSTLFSSRTPWERSLAGIESVLKVDDPAETLLESSRRIVWSFDERTKEVNAFEEKFRKGVWKRGREISGRRLLANPEDYTLSEFDRKIIKSFRVNSGYGLWGEWSPDPIQTPLALCGHPHVYDSIHPEMRLELEAALPELLIDEAPGGFRIDLSHRSPQPQIFFERLAPTRFRVVHLDPQAVELGKNLPPEGLVVPAEARDRLLALLSRRAPFVEIRAEINAGDLPAEEGDPSPVLQISPLEDGISVVAGVRPFGPDGPFFSVGRGGRLVTCHGGSTRHARRNHEEEISRLSALLDHLPLLKEQGSEEGIWTLPDPLSALECLEALAACPLPVTVEWPQGETLRTSPPVSMKKLRLSLRSARDWFEVSGQVEVDESLVLDMKDLLDALPRAKGRFVPLSDGRFLSLTQELKNRLERLAAISEEGGKISIPGTMALDDIFSEAGNVSGDTQWKAFRKKVREAASYEPTLPSTFAGDLRDYQREGFAWMSRLARWGAGACLADDMGLGKTVQTIAVMLDLAKGGPVLVVAPTSVCHNWETEISRFAPTLSVHELRTAPDRRAMVESLGPGEVLLTSYGLLSNEEALLAEKKWAMAVFDEAQAFKNAESKRAQAARKIDAEFRAALTGTPVENDLDELWSLFSVINPRLLGSRERFANRFASPIERGKDSRVMASLRSLVRPFMLRRTKTAVLSELPPRTEITLDIELSTEERAFYEALRRKALETLEELSGREKGSSRIHILAEITKLRRALCHPALVEPLTLLPGAKLDSFHLLVDELLSNRHKALVFSQFTGFLDRVAKSLDARKIPYQYLDGSTPPKEREKRVAAFQAGQGDLFLISLRAGGTGLNLTAADYVIHLDPWWNPAVEDQASDRAHRIGQQRPVTIYRLIVRESLEEKILELHKKKRDLATDLLEGGEISGKLTNEELMALLGA